MYTFVCPNKLLVVLKPDTGLWVYFRRFLLKSLKHKEREHLKRKSLYAAVWEGEILNI
jgi:hypothetical protein